MRSNAFDSVRLAAFTCVRRSRGVREAFARRSRGVREAFAKRSRRVRDAFGMRVRKAGVRKRSKAFGSVQRRSRTLGLSTISVGLGWP